MYLTGHGCCEVIVRFTDPSGSPGLVAAIRWSIPVRLRPGVYAIIPASFLPSGQDPVSLFWVLVPSLRQNVDKKGSHGPRSATSSGFGGSTLSQVSLSNIVVTETSSNSNTN